MSAQPFKFVSVPPITTQPDSGGEKLIARSSNAADTGNLTVFGTVGSAGDSETNALLGKREVETTDQYKSLTQATLSAAQAGAVKIYGQGTAGTASIRVETNPADAVTLTIGLTGFTKVYRFKNTPAQAFDVKIGASAAATATNLKKAINADGAGDGSDYYTGTTAHPHLSAAVSGANVNLTDRIAVLRQLAWSFAQSSTEFSLPTNLTGAALGTLLATLNIGATQVHKTFTLATEDLATGTVPALFTGKSQALYCGGKPACLRLRAADLDSAIDASYETSTDKNNWITGIGSITALDDNNQFVVPDEQNFEYVRLSIDTNANTADAEVDARAIA